jgi:predicted dehydrogenase
MRRVAERIYRTAIVGARRGLHHMRAYAGLEDRARVTAIAEIDAERRAAAAAAVGPGVQVYSDWLEMLDRERPDILHVVTSPTIPRAQWVQPAADAGVRVLALEKPIALRPSEADALLGAAERAGIKVAVNLQRRYMPFAGVLMELLADAERGLGPVHFVRASSAGMVADMYPHLLDLVLLAVGDAQPSHVWAAVEGSETDPRYPGPRQLMAECSFVDGTRALCEISHQSESPFGWRDFPAVYPPDIRPWGPHRCNVDVWAERGRFWWREYGTWGYQVEGRPPRSEPTAFRDDDVPAQRAYTAALVDWLEVEGMEGAPHRCSLATAGAGFALLSGALRSALLGQRLGYPEAGNLSDAEYGQLMERLGATQPAQPALSALSGAR